MKHEHLARFIGRRTRINGPFGSAKGVVLEIGVSHHGVPWLDFGGEMRHALPLGTVIQMVEETINFEKLKHAWIEMSSMGSPHETNFCTVCGAQRRRVHGIQNWDYIKAQEKDWKQYSALEPSCEDLR